tara:strand:+ start:714 stop:851 length:138 start_codon:yes stop_codon:yes gene_type:complete
MGRTKIEGKSYKLQNALVNQSFESDWESQQQIREELKDKPNRCLV